MEPAIRVENLGKLYRVTQGAERAGYTTLRDTLAHAAGAPLRWARHGFAKPDPAEDFWALKGVEFEVQPGEVVGIIGRNGAGKSTLLKILSRITKPTTGRVTLNGRVGSLLEVGTGFHPELTGRENVYLNGSILGMSRREIAKKFDEIVAFAEVERFLDTPVKRYSSGMYVRLAFAVAAHLEPEILIVDEVLAVGDAGFQQKCLKQMRTASKAGRTILLVTHTMSVLEQLATTSLLLEKGRLVCQGPTRDVISRYQASSQSSVNNRYELGVRWRDPGLRRNVALEWVGLADCPTRSIAAEAALEFDVGVRTLESTTKFRVSFTVCRQGGSAVGSVFCAHVNAPEVGRTGVYRVRLDRHNLAPGDYYIDMATGRGNNSDEGYADFDIVQEVLHFTVRSPVSDETLASWNPSWGPIRFQTPSVTYC